MAFSFEARRPVNYPQFFIAQQQMPYDTVTPMIAPMRPVPTTMATCPPVISGGGMVTMVEAGVGSSWANPASAVRAGLVTIGCASDAPSNIACHFVVGAGMLFCLSMIFSSVYKTV
jgi:hypothetical protein